MIRLGSRNGSWDENKFIYLEPYNSIQTFISRFDSQECSSYLLKLKVKLFDGSKLSKFILKSQICTMRQLTTTTRVAMYQAASSKPPRILN